jgi:uncharacterized LabA/DUF88 family protein
MTTYVYVDNSNLYIEGCRVSAVNKGTAKNIFDAMNKNIVDMTWQLDYGKLYNFLCGNDAVARLWGSPPPGDSFWKMVDRKGFKSTVYDKGAGNKEKKVDVAIGAAMTKDAYTKLDKDKDKILLVAGDSDYEPVITDLKTESYKVEVAFWDHASAEIKKLVDSGFISLNKHHAHFTR